MKEPCKYIDCQRHYSDDKKCKTCGHAYINKISIIDRLLYGREERPIDRYVSISRLKQIHKENAFGIICIGALLFILVYLYWVMTW